MVKIFHNEGILSDDYRYRDKNKRINPFLWSSIIMYKVAQVYRHCYLEKACFQ